MLLAVSRIAVTSCVRRLDKALKTFGSATSYGIFAQMDRQETDEKVSLKCYGIDPEPYDCRVSHPEAPGEFCFPPLAALITSGGAHARFT